MNKKTYTSAIKKTPFEYLYSQKIAELMIQGLSYNEIFRKCYEENELQIVSEQRRKEVLNVVYDRLSKLDKYLLEEFLNSSIDSSKFILVYAIAVSDLLFFEFLITEYRGVLLSKNKNYISDSDFDDFFATIKEKNTVVANWSDRTIRQLGCGYRNIIINSGLGRREKNLIYSKKVIIKPLVAEHIKKINMPFIQAVLGD